MGYGRNRKVDSSYIISARLQLAAVQYLYSFSPLNGTTSEDNPNPMPAIPLRDENEYSTSAKSPVG